MPGTGRWIRTCDECGHVQEDKEPSREKELTNAYCDRKCKKCKSPALDYGTFERTPEQDAEFEREMEELEQARQEKGE